MAVFIFGRTFLLNGSVRVLLIFICLQEMTQNLHEQLLTHSLLSTQFLCSFHCCLAIQFFSLLGLLFNFVTMYCTVSLKWSACSFNTHTSCSQVKLVSFSHWWSGVLGQWMTSCLHFLTAGLLLCSSRMEAPEGVAVPLRLIWRWKSELRCLTPAVMEVQIGFISVSLRRSG